MPTVARFGSPLLITTLLTLAASCAEERAPINRVQAGAMDKEFFVGDLADASDDPQFFWRNFVVDGSEQQSLIGIGSWSGVDRIRWEITEHALFARRAYSTGGDDKGEEDPHGTIIAAYAIEKHFDVQRAYNPQTGEELNIVEENTTDRPWYDREHFRVDWSKNEVDSPQWIDMFVGKVFGDLELTPIAYYESDLDSPDAPHFDVDEGYFDITSRFLIGPKPGPTFFGLEIPLCYLEGLFTQSAIPSCEAQEAVIRSSYWRVERADPDDDFEPLENTTAQTTIFGNPGGLGSSVSRGIVTPALESYDPQYGYTDVGLQRLAHIHDIWDKSHQTAGSCRRDADCTGNARCLPSGSCTVPCRYRARGDGDGNGTDDQCENATTGYEGSEGAQCSARDRCTIPYRDRELAPIAYWVNDLMPDALQDSLDDDGEPTTAGANEDIIATWNQALQVSVARAREIECRRTAEVRVDDQGQPIPGANRNRCHRLYFEVADGADVIQMVTYGGWGLETPKVVDDVIVLCHNPVRSYDPGVCGAEGDRARVGDLRKHFLFYWPYASRAPWGGIANWNADPLTGQIIGASATTMGRSATRSAANVRDIILVALGELDLEDITNGTPAALYQRQLREGRKPVHFTAAQILQKSAALDIDAALGGASLGLDASGSIAERLRRIAADQANTKLDYQALSAQLLELNAALAPVIGSEIEAQMVDPNWLVDAAALSPDSPTSESLLDQASPLRGQELGRLALFSQLSHDAFDRRGVCFLNEMQGVGNPDVQGVAKYFGALYSDARLVRDHGLDAGSSDARLRRERAEKIYEHLWRETYKGIQLHEIGHSLGMLHNFASSYDSLNYLPQYWQLRTQEGRAGDLCGADPRTGDTDSAEADTCMGPRYLDPVTDDEMGRADESRPGINYFGHTSTMEYQHTRFFETAGLGQYDVMTMNALYGRVLQTFEPAADMYEYTALHTSQLTEQLWASWEGGICSGGCTQPLHYTRLANRLDLYGRLRCRDATGAEKRQGEWRVVHEKICAPPRKDYAHWDDFEDSAPEAFGGTTLQARIRVRGGKPYAAGNLRWPYRFGVSFNGYVHTNPFDAGADIYEVTTQTIEDFDTAYPFRYFRRRERGWDDSGVPSRTARNFYERMRSYHWNAARDAIRYRELFARSTFEQLSSSDDFLRPAAMASVENFNGIARSLTTPQPGEYPRAAGAVVDEGDGGAQFRPFTLDASFGRYIEPRYDSAPSAGGDWDYLGYAHSAGFYVEKTYAARTLTDGRSVLTTLSRDNFLDRRAINLTYRGDLARAVDRLLGGLLSNEWETVAPSILFRNGVPDALVPLDLTVDAPEPPPSGQRVHPNVGYNQQMPSMLWAMLFARADADLTLNNKMRIWVDGLVGELEVPDEQQIRFSNPESGITYIARLFGPDVVAGVAVDAGIGSRMLGHANALLLDVFDVERDPITTEPLLDAYGRATLITDTDGLPVLLDPDDVSGLTEFRRYVGLIDGAVQIANMVGYGPFNRPPFSL